MQHIGEQWPRNLEQLSKLNDLINNPGFVRTVGQVKQVKRFFDDLHSLLHIEKLGLVFLLPMSIFLQLLQENKMKLASFIKTQWGVDVDPASMFDVQVKL